MTSKKFLVVLALGLLLASALTAQTGRQTGVIKGVLTDAGGRPCRARAWSRKVPA